MRLLKKTWALLVLACVLMFYVQGTAKTGEKTGNLCANPDLRQRDASGVPVGYTVTGSAAFGFPGDTRAEVADYSAILTATGPAGSVSQWVTGIDTRQSRWYRFSVRGLPEDRFMVGNDNLYLRVEFFGSDGVTPYDGKEKRIYQQVLRARKDLTVNGVRHRGGAEVWQSYQMDFMLPFPQVHQLKLTVGFADGASGAGKKASFAVTGFSLLAIEDPAGVSTAEKSTSAAKPSKAVVPQFDRLIALGGRWFYAARSGETQPPPLFDDTNADRLLYRDVIYFAPFANNTTAWLHKGNIDAAGNTVETDRFVEDNVTIAFDRTSLIMHTHGLPNHPTAMFPSQGYGVGNPNSIREQKSTYYIPLNPIENPTHKITARDNSNHALNMGPIGVAVNGVVFYNPFDANSTDATDLMDRCCGHPNPDGQYHYHKYPVCVNSPWADEGEDHSPLIGFAFDGYPVYGPYESKDVMAKDITGVHALNGFNMHYDDQRGWHYHVTPGVFPYLIGGYWGAPDARDVDHRGGPGGMGPPGGGRFGSHRFGPPPGM